MSSQAKARIPAGHLPFEMRFIYAALAIALFAGFGIGAHMAFIIGLQMPLHTGFQTYIQLHGHVQLIGWVGLFVMGVSLHVLPRLLSVAISDRLWLHAILACVAGGIALRTVTHSILPYVIGTPYFDALQWLSVLSAILEWLGIYIYLMLVLKLFLVSEPARTRSLKAIRPFFAMQVFGWGVSALLNLGLLVRMASAGAPIAIPAWNQFNVELFIGLVLLPVAFAFSIKMLPLYLRLRGADWSVRSMAAVYFIGFCAQILPQSPLFVQTFSQTSARIVAVGAVVKAIAILYFIYQLDVLTRSKSSWREQVDAKPKEDRRPTRAGLPDYGEFGRFERLISAAYSWLALAALFDVFYAIGDQLGLALPHKCDLVRHLYLVGFITMLILGMAVRMLPGFLGKKRVASTWLVDATFWLGNLAVVCRVLPLIVTFPALNQLATLVRLAEIAFACSGVFGILAIICLAVNLRKTANA